MTELDPYKCLQHANWYFCHAVFPVCVFDKTNTTWKTVPVCKESCSTLLNHPSCKAMIPDEDLLVKISNTCKDFFNMIEVGVFYCRGPLIAERNRCLSSPPSNKF